MGTSAFQQTLPRDQGGQQRTRANSPVIILSIAALLFLALANYYTYLHWDFDDSYIVYRISRNILRGYGWVYNVGESHNASTSVLNVVATTALAYVIRDVRLAAHIIGGLAILGTGVTAYWLFRQRFDNNMAIVVGFVLIQELSGNRSWGLETNLLICLTLLFVLMEMYEKNTWALLGFIVLTRPDGILLMGLKWLKGYISHRSYSLKGIVTFLVVLAPWVVYSLVHFGRIFPDTLSQKLWQGHSGLWGTGPVYLNGLIDYYLVTSNPLQKVALIGAVIGSILMLRHRSQLLYLVLFALLQQIAYAGLNVPPYHWYLALADAALYIAALYAVGTILWAGREHLANIDRFTSSSHVLASATRALSLLVPIVVLLTGVLIAHSEHQHLSRDPRSLAYVAAIQEIDRRFGPGRLATVEVGFIGFYTDRTVVDITGLTSASGQFATPDRMDVFFDDPPELLLLHEPIWAHEAAIYNDYRFPFTYEKEVILAEKHPTLQLYVRKQQDHERIDVLLSETYPTFELDNRFNLDDMKPLSQGAVHLDYVNGYLARQHPLVVNQRALLQVQGWAVVLEQQQPPANILILLRHENGPIYSLPAVRMARPDVADALNDSVYLRSGFKAEGLTAAMPSGTYAIYVIQESKSVYYFVKLENKIVIPELE